MGTPHLKIPFALAEDGSAQTVEQGTSEEITQCVANLVGTLPGTRHAIPAYGIPDPTFSGLNLGLLNVAARKYEPRATVSVTVTPANQEVVVVGVAGGTP